MRLDDLRPLQVARLCSAAGVLLATVLAVELVPRIAWLGDGVNTWRLGLCGGALAFIAGLVVWARVRLGGLDDRPPDDPVRRREAHDFPVRLARACFLAAVVAGIGTTAFLWGGPGGPARATVTGVVTYLLLVLPVLGVYLLSRRALRHHAAGPPGAPPVAGGRQSVALRLAFAVQLPVVVCAVGIVLVEQSGGNAYDREVEAYHRQLYDHLVTRTLRLLDDDEARRAFVTDLRPPPGVVAAVTPDGAIRHHPLAVDEAHVRPLALRLPPYLLLGIVTLLSALLGAWLARAVTTDLADVGRALRRLRQEPRPDEVEPMRVDRAVALRETAALLRAFQQTLAGFRARRGAIREAAIQRRQAEHAKARFLAHLSHELKSPLNSILGFTELLLAGVEGPLDDRQREHLNIIWRSGDSLLRFILALLDLARLEAPQAGEAPRASGLRPRPTTVGELLRAAREQLRPDPLGAVELTLALPPDPAAPVHVDVEYTARALVLAGGVLLDAMDHGEVEVRLHPDGDEVEARVEVISADGDAGVRAQLVEQLGTEWPQGLPEEGDHRFGGAAATLVLLRWLTEAQGGRCEVVPGRWPGFVMRLPMGCR